jgi:superfamily II DNA/RNA helicase
VHRIGRTGRAGQEGRAFTLILPEERRFVDAITRLTGKEIPRLEIPGLEAVAPVEPAAPRRTAGRNGARARQEPPSGSPAPSQPVERAPAERRPSPLRATGAEARKPTRRPGRAEGPVVGMGDHVPLFMRRPVPNAELLPKLSDD